jgi:hypothetical protein
MTAATPKSFLVSGAARRVSPCPSAAMDLDSCRQAIERAAANKVSSKGKALTIRRCLLDSGLSERQASNRTMQARVRREVQRRLCQVRSHSRKLDAIPREISIPSICPQIPGDLFDDFDAWCAEVLDDSDNISVLTNPMCFQTFPSGTRQLHQQTSGTPRPTESPIPSSLAMMSALIQTDIGRKRLTSSTLSENSQPFHVSPDSSIQLQGLQSSLFRLQAMAGPCLSRRS